MKQELIDFLCFMVESHRINDISKDVMEYIVDEYLKSINLHQGEVDPKLIIND